MIRFRLLPTLMIVATLTLGVRVADLWQLGNGTLPVVGAAAAQAQEAPAAVAPEVEPAAVASANAGSSNSTPTLSPSAQPPVVSDADVSPRIAARLAQLDQRARELDQQEAFLQATEQRLDQKLAELQGLRDEIQALLGQYDQAQAQKIDSLVRIYEAMKPAEAAIIFETLDMSVLLSVVQRMKESKLADILASLSPARAQQVTVALAERKALPEDAVDPQR